MPFTTKPSFTLPIVPATSNQASGQYAARAALAHYLRASQSLPPTSTGNNFGNTFGKISGNKSGNNFGKHSTLPAPPNTHDILASSQFTQVDFVAQSACRRGFNRPLPTSGNIGQGPARFRQDSGNNFGNICTCGKVSQRIVYGPKPRYKLTQPFCPSPQTRPAGKKDKKSATSPARIPATSRPLASPCSPHSPFPQGKGVGD